MLERTNTKALPLINRAADLAPAAQACCGLCRSCMTANIFAAASAALATLALDGRRIWRYLAKPS